MRLQRRGNSYVGLCPFHQEKSPSFHVVPHKRLYHCFGCQAGGDCFRFLMEIEGVSFIEAVKELASAAGVDIEQRELSEEERRRLRLRASLYDVLDAASAFWEAVLWTRPEGAKAREYLHGRGLTQETCREWRLGYAPGGWTTTVDRLQREGFPMELLADAGLAKARRQGSGFYDTFRDRITIPITDERGRLLAFGARLLEGDGPKYLNSPETELYSKSRVLFGLQHARQPIQRRDRALLVEGYFDVISLHQAGFPEAVATCGTALTQDHLEKLRRLTSQVVALFDADEAGSRAAEKSLPLFLQAGVLPFRLEVPGAKDPDELVREEGPGAMEAALGMRVPLLEWVIDRRLGKSGGGAAAREGLLDELVELLALTEGTEIVARVAARLKVREVVLQQRVAEARRRQSQRPVHRDPMAIAPSGPSTPPPQHDPGPDLGRPPWEEDEEEERPPAPPPPWRPSRDHVHVLWLLVHRLDQTLGLARAVAPAPWADTGPARPVFERLVAGEDAAAILPDIDEAGTRRTLMAVVAREHLYTEDQAAEGMVHVLHRLLVPHLEGEQARLAASNRAAIQRQDWDAQARTTSDQQALRKLRKSVEGRIKAGDLDGWIELASEIAARVTRGETAPDLSTGFTSG